MKARFGLPVLLSLFLIAGAACEKTKPENDSNNFLEVRSATLSDSLSAKTVSSMHATELSGISITHPGESRQVFYYEYSGEKVDVLRAIALSPFNKYETVSDTVCREVALNRYRVLKNRLSGREVEESIFFWDIKADDYEVFECIKAPAKHTILFKKNSKTILHRIQIG